MTDVKGNEAEHCNEVDNDDKEMTDEPLQGEASIEEDKMTDEPLQGERSKH